MTGTSETTFGQRLRAATQEHGPLCAGIDPHRTLIESWSLTYDLDGLTRFTETCVEAFAGHVGIVKPQSAFFEVFGSAGLAVLERATRALQEAGTLVLVDAKRGDIGNTMAAYAAASLGRVRLDGPPRATHRRPARRLRPEADGLVARGRDLADGVVGDAVAANRAAHVELELPRRVVTGVAARDDVRAGVILVRRRHGVAEGRRLLVRVEPARPAGGQSQQEEIPHPLPDTPTIKKLPPWIDHFHMALQGALPTMALIEFDDVSHAKIFA